MKITGKFKVKMQPLKVAFSGKDGIKVARMYLDKTFEGELSALSQGEMYSAVTNTPGSAGYVAIEQVIGKLAGKSGSFLLQHYGIMNQGDAQLKLEVVPDSGSNELKGLKGSMAIRIEDGQHFYDFEYELG